MARTEYGTTWWGQKWLEALNNIDFDNRIPRGKSYANTGKVLSFKLDFSKHKISAKVKGHYDPFYRVEIELPPISQTSKEKLLEAIASSPLVVAKLSTRELDPELLTLCRQIGVELFPRSWNDLKMNCTCPDWAVPCKHLAAVIYKISQEIDANPFILFSLRGLDLIGELEKQGISIERALTAELPSWSELLAQAAPPESELFASKSHESNNFQLENYASENDWLEGLGRLSFKDVTFDAEALLNLLQEKPAGFVGSSLKEEISKVLS